MFIGVWNVTTGNIFADPAEKARDAKSAKAALLGVPLNFEANQGQTNSRVKFLSHGDGYALFLTSHEAVFTLRPPAGAKAPLRPRFSVWKCGGPIVQLGLPAPISWQA
jgi:hypothetical protein